MKTETGTPLAVPVFSPEETRRMARWLLSDLTDLELQSILDALLFMEKHAGLVSDAHANVRKKIVRCLPKAGE